MKLHEPAAKVQGGRLFRLLLPGVAILIFGIAVLLGLMVYKVSYPGVVAEAVNPLHYLLPSLELWIPSSKGPDISAWWIPGLKHAPGIILAPGYGMNRADALSLAVALNQRGFNILIYAQRGNGASPREASTLGLREAEDMADAVRFLQRRPESDPEHIGIWGVDVSAFAALKTAAAFSVVRTIAVDSPFETVKDYLDYRIAEDFGLNNSLLRWSCYQGFRLAHFFGRASLNNELSRNALSGKAILFIKGEEHKSLADLTTAIHAKIQPPNELISFGKARTHAMSGEMLKAYDKQVAGFFRINLK